MTLEYRDSEDYERNRSMVTSKTIAKGVIISVVFSLCHLASGEEPTTDPNAARATTATIELASLDVNDSALRLNCRIRNNSDHEVWVCSNSGEVPFEVYLTQDKQTLLIRKRLDVPNDGIRYSGPGGMPVGTYVRLKSGEDRTESLKIDLPVKPVFEYAAPSKEEVSQVVRRLAFEVGYYDEDLPALVQSIFKIADLFTVVGRGTVIDAKIYNTYFRGLAVRGGLIAYDFYNKDPCQQGAVRIPYSSQALTGENILWIDANNVSIPYRGVVQGPSLPANILIGR
jgi:hypothetical protein